MEAELEEKVWKMFREWDNGLISARVFQTWLEKHGLGILDMWVLLQERHTNELEGAESGRRG